MTTILFIYLFIYYKHRTTATTDLFSILRKRLGTAVYRIIIFGKFVHQHWFILLFYCIYYCEF